MADLIQEMLECQLSSMFKMTDMGPLNYCIGIGVSHGDGWLQLQQRQYLLNIIHRFVLDDAHSVPNPADINMPLTIEDGVSQPTDQRLYQQMIGSLQYAAGGTRPDIAFIVGVLARFCNAPTQLHLNAAKRVFRYLKGTVNLSLTYTQNANTDLTGCSDADFTGDRDTRRSTSGNVFMLSGAAITWSSKRQASVTLSAVEAEYMALSLATQEAVKDHWLIPKQTTIE